MPSNITHHELPEFLSEKTKQEFLDIGMNLKDEDWTVHHSTKTGKPSVLHFYDLKKTFHGRNCYLVMIRPNAIQDWHIDGGKRNTALIYPLTDEYAPCKFQLGETSAPMFLNTQAKHAVFNNNKKRINLNISFEDDIEDCIKFFEEIDKYEFDPS